MTLGAGGEIAVPGIDEVALLVMDLMGGGAIAWHGLFESPPLMTGMKKPSKTIRIFKGDAAAGTTEGAGTRPGRYF